MKSLNKIKQFCLVLSFLLIANPLIKAELYGFNVAELDSLPSYIPPVNKYFNIPNSNFTDLRFELNKKGEVKGVYPVDEEDSLVLDFFSDYLNSLTFKPATYNGKEVKSTLFGKITYRGNVKNSTFIIPGNNPDSWEEYGLLLKSAAASGLSLPKFKTFPAMNHDVEAKDSLLVYPFGFYKVRIDESGKVLAIDSLYSTLGTFDGQVQAAIMYSDILPLSFKKKKSGAEFYLLVSAFARHSYPTKEWSDRDTVLYDRLRIRQIYQLGEILSPAIPDFSRATFLPGSIFKLFTEDVYLRIKVDTLGGVKIVRSNSLNSSLRKRFMDFFRDNQFYPAIDLEGKPVEFEGSIRFYLDTAKNVRIEYLWLEE